MEFVITIRNKIAEYAGDAIYVCGNADCKIVFDFDIAWDGIGVKTARFVKDDGTYQEQVFTGNECPMPVIAGTHGIRVGVYAGNLHTTTPAYIPAKKSILCASGMPSAPSDDVYAQIMEHLNQIEQNGVSDAEIKAAIEAYLIENPIEGVTPEEVEAAIEKYMQEHPVLVEESDPTVPDWAKQPVPPKYTAQDVGALPADTPIPAPYTLPTASAEVKGGVKVGSGLQMDGDVLGVEPEGDFELIETATIEDEITLFSRSAEPNGAAYNFIKLYVDIKTPTGTEKKVGVVSLMGEPIPMYYFTNMIETHSAGAWAKVLAEINSNMLTGSGVCGINGSSQLGWTNANPYVRGFAEIGHSSIDYLQFAIVSGKIPVGTVIEIWGVRADA